MMPPQATIHRGSAGGRVSPYNRPVMVTDQSRTVEGAPASRHSRCSVPTQDSTATASVSAAASPNRYMANAATGSRAKTTLRMITSTLAPLRICGEVWISRVCPRPLMRSPAVS